MILFTNIFSIIFVFMMMLEFYIEVALERGVPRLQVEAIEPGGWDIPGCPQFMIDYFTGQHFLTLTLRLESGTWYDCNTRHPEDDFSQRNIELEPEKAWDPDYKCPLNLSELKLIGNKISDHMVVMLNGYMSLFVPQYRTPTLN